MKVRRGLLRGAALVLAVAVGIWEATLGVPPVYRWLSGYVGYFAGPLMLLFSPVLLVVAPFYHLLVLGDFFPLIGGLLAVGLFGLSENGIPSTRLIVRALGRSGLAGAMITAIGWGATLIHRKAAGAVATVVLLPGYLIFGAVFGRYASGAGDYVTMTVFAWVVWTALLALPMLVLAHWRSRRSPPRNA